MIVRLSLLAAAALAGLPREAAALDASDASGALISCQNTRAGRLHLADSTGHVCPRASFLSHTGCCDTSDDASQKYSCETCETELDGCCSSYEHCVSCCMRPENHGNTDLSTKTEFFRDKTFTFESTFAFCEAACRTTSSSTLHENMFIGDRRYCYRFNQGGFKRPRMDDNDFTSLQASSSGEGGTRIVAGEENESCTDVCGRLSPPMTCDDHQFSSTCDQMRQYFMCEAGCYGHQNDVSTRETTQETYPSYIQGWGPQPDWPAACFPDARASSNCGAKQPHVRRLCECLSPDP